MAEIGWIDALVILFAAMLAFSVVMVMSYGSCVFGRQVWALWSRLLDLLYAAYEKMWGVVGFLFKVALFVLLLLIVYAWYTTPEQKRVVEDITGNVVPAAQTIFSHVHSAVVYSNHTANAHYYARQLLQKLQSTNQ